MRSPPRPVKWLLIAGAAGLALAPLSRDRFWIQFLAKGMIGGIYAMSLDLLVGFTGLVSLGHAAFFGLAGYLLAALGNQAGVAQLWITLPLCMGAAALLAWIVGYLSLRTSGAYFIMVTLAFSQMLYFIFADSPYFGGSDGLYLNLRPRLSVAGRTLLDFQAAPGAYAATWLALVLVYAFLVRLLRSPFGRVIEGIRVNESRMRSLGYPTRRYKLVSFVIAGTLAGLSGWLDAGLYGFVNPAHLGWRESGLVLITVLLGGKGTFYGPALGAFLLSFLQYYGERLTDHWLALVGAVVIAVVLFLPRGVASLLELRRAGIPGA